MERNLLVSIVDPNLFRFVILGIIIITIALVLRYVKQPYIIAYIIAGLLLGRHGFSVLTEIETIKSLGEFGLILLLFFIGMEINIPGLIKEWKASSLATIFQVLASILISSILGNVFQWPLSRILLVGFIISLSSSAIVIKLLQDSGEINSDLGRKVVGILLTQDILIIPMLVSINYLGGSPPPFEEILLQLFGAAAIVGLLFNVISRKNLSFPFGSFIEKDHELQVFISFSLCFGFALFTAAFGLSAALGAFVAGLMVSASKATHWFHESLHSFRVIFVALFFVSVGMLIDLEFLIEQKAVILLLLTSVFVINQLINGLVLQSTLKDWRKSIYGGAMLAQVGELSFILISQAFNLNIVNDYSYQLVIIIISLSLLISPLWIQLFKRIISFSHSLN